VLVQAFIAEPAVEALDEPVLLRLARRDVVPGDATFLMPAQHRVRGQLGAVVADDHRRATVQRQDPVECTPHVEFRQRRIRHPQRFSPHNQLAVVMRKGFIEMDNKLLPDFQR
jgi:hypothetical protein